MRSLLALLSVVIIVFFNHTFVVGQAPLASPAMAAAAELIKQQKFAEGAAAYETILRSEPQNGPAWFQLASARYWLKDYPASAAAYQKNIPISNNPYAMYNLACVYALMGDKEKAVDWLQKSLDNPKMVVGTVNFDDPDLASVRSDPRVAAMADSVDHKIKPCMYSSEAKQFNFWIGEWDVYDLQGRKDGTSSIQSFASGCGILENWHGSVGGDGKSINFYDDATGKWYQYWIGASGGPLRYAGVFRDGAIRYEGEAVGKDGKTTQLRLTFFDLDANTVRQLAENSSDGGKTWTVGYDLKYIRRK